MSKPVADGRQVDARLEEVNAIARTGRWQLHPRPHSARQVQVLVLDDLLIAPLKDSERRDLLEILEDRYDRTSTVITSQLPTAKWHAALGDPTVADAICDRVVHNAHVVTLTGSSGRKRKGLNSKA